MWGFLTSLIHGGDDDVTLRAAHENVPIDVRIQSTLNRVEKILEYSAMTSSNFSYEWTLDACGIESGQRYNSELHQKTFFLYGKRHFFLYGKT